MLAATPAREALRLVLLSRAAGRLPGLVGALQNLFAEQAPSSESESSGDFGEDLLQERGEPAGVTVQSADATAQAAHELATRIQSGEMPRGYLDFTIPLPKSDPQSGSAAAKKRTFRLLSFDL